MFKLFKKTKTLFWLIGILGGIIVGIISGIALKSIGQCLANTLLWAIAVSIVLEFKAIKLFNEIEKLRQDCRIGEAVEKYEELLPKANGKSLNTVRNNLFTCCFSKGDFERAEFYISSISPSFPDNSAGIFSKCIYYQNLAALYVETDRLIEAEKALNAARLLFENPKLTFEHKTVSASYWHNEKMTLNIKSGHFDVAQKYFETKLLTDTTKLSKVTDNRFLAEIYIHYGEVEKAKECCSFIIENGGDTCYVTLAKKMLDSINAQQTEI